MAIGIETGGYPQWACVPDPIIITGLVPGSKLTYDYSVGERQVVPSARTFEQRLYFYASSEGKVYIDRSYLKQRGAASIYTTLINQNKTTLECTWRETTFLYSDSCTGIAADTQEETDVILGEFRFVWGGLPLQELPGSDTLYRLYTTLAGGHFLTRATTVEVHKDLPHSLIYLTHSSNTGSAFSYKKGLTTQALTLTAQGAVHTQYLAETYGDGTWTLGRTNQLLPGARLYKVIVDSRTCILDKLKDGRLVYLRWLNSLGGLSYGLFEVKGRSRSIAASIKPTRYTSQVASGGLLPSDYETLQKANTISLAIGKGRVGWDRMLDFEDLTTSIEVLMYDATYGVFIPVQVSNGSAADRSRTYNDFSCVVTLHETFTQKR